VQPAPRRFTGLARYTRL